jgi:hypothetical protein
LLSIALPFSESEIRLGGCAVVRQQAADGGTSGPRLLGRPACCIAQELEIQDVFTNSTLEFGTTIRPFSQYSIILAAVVRVIPNTLGD